LNGAVKKETGRTAAVQRHYHRIAPGRKATEAHHNPDHRSIVSQHRLAGKYAGTIQQRVPSIVQHIACPGRPRLTGFEFAAKAWMNASPAGGPAVPERARSSGSADAALRAMVAAFIGDGASSMSCK
jgi:hypothetical protein